MRILALPCAVLGLMAAPLAFAQEATATWQHIGALNGDRGEIKAMKLAANGDIVVAGFLPKPGSASGRALSEGWVARYSPDGRELWSRTVGGPVRDEALGLDVGADGSVAVVGWRDISGLRTHYAFAAKFAADGTLAWETVLRDPVLSSFASSVQVLEDGSVLMSGTQLGGDEGTRWRFVAALDAMGAVRWNATPTREAAIVASPGSIDAAPKVVSVFSSTASAIGAIRTDGSVEMLLRPDSANVPLASNCVVLSLADGSDTGGTCTHSLSAGRKPGESYAGGQTGPFGASDIQVSKFRGDGSIAWQRQPKTPWGDGINAVAETPDGGVVAAGFRLTSGKVGLHNWDGLLVRFDADGKLLWSKQFGGKKRDEFKGVAVLADGSIIGAGYTGSQPGAPDWAPWILRLTADGELEGAALKQIQERQF